jgi:hypothetical protein
MSLKLAAEHLKNQGRNTDTELVHMTKGEVKGLRELALAHGGDLTINPETGLPEAGFLSSILPVVAGAAAIALAPETGGASLALEPWMVGAGVGLADWAITGNLKQGIMAGLGAYGGAGLTSSLMASGAEVAAGSAGTATNAAAQEAGRQAVEQAAAAGADKAAQEAARQAAIDEASSRVTQESMKQAYPGAMANMGTGLKAAAAAPGTFLSNNMGVVGAALAPAAMSAPPGNVMPGTQQQSNPFGLKTLSPDFKGSFPTPPNPHYQAQYTDYTKNPYQGGPQAQPQNMAVGGIAQAQPANVDFMGGDMFPQSQQQRSYYATPTQAPTGAQQVMASYEPKTNPLTGETIQNMASGGIASYAGKTGSLVDAMNTYNASTKQGIVDLPRTSGADPGIYTDTDPNTRNLDAYGAALYNLKKRAKKAGMSKNAVALPDVKQLGDIEEDAAGGLMAGHGLGGYSDGGRLLKGPGDGMSDSIPAQIGKHQPARLADGEFVVPADVVSHLGNGSTEAGAKQLYAMMDKIRSARTGKKKQAPEVKPEKYLPK